MKTIYYLIMGAVCSLLFKLHIISADTYKKYKKLYYNKKMAIFYILDILKEFSDSDHLLTQKDIINKLHDIYFSLLF